MPLESDGIDIDAFEAALADGPVKLAHVIPNFHNPAGCTLSAAKRDRLVELAAEHDFWIFEDDPYRLIRFGDAELPPTMLSTDDSGHVIHASSFSKTVSPGVRVGYLAGPGRADRDARQARLRALHLAEHARRVGGARALPLRRPGPQHRVRQRRPGRAPRRAGRRALREQIPEAEFVVPGGGYFLWLDLDRRRRHAGAARGRRATRASRSSPAPTSCSRAASPACGSRSRAFPPIASPRASRGSPGRSASLRAASPA